MDQMEAYPVSSPRNEGRELLEPVTVEAR